MNCYLLHVPRLPSQPGSSGRGWVIYFIWLELPWQYIAMTRNNLSIILISLANMFYRKILSSIFLKYCYRDISHNNNYLNFWVIKDKTLKLQIHPCQLWHPLLISVLVNNQRLWRRAKTTITIIIIMMRKKKAVQILQHPDLRLKNSHNRSNLSYNNNKKVRHKINKLAPNYKSQYSI